MTQGFLQINVGSAPQTAWNSSWSWNFCLCQRLGKGKVCTKDHTGFGQC